MLLCALNVSASEYDLAVSCFYLTRLMNVTRNAPEKGPVSILLYDLCTVNERRCQ